MSGLGIEEEKDWKPIERLTTKTVYDRLVQRRMKMNIMSMTTRE